MLYYNVTQWMGRRQASVAVHHLSGRIPQGSRLALVGPNGAGKTTLLKAIMGLVRLDGGRIHVSAARSKRGYLPQQAEIDRRFLISALETVMLGHWAWPSAS